jgi:hypothetical protein
MLYVKKVRSVNTIQHAYSHDLPSTSVAREKNVSQEWTIQKHRSTHWAQNTERRQRKNKQIKKAE